MKRNLYACSVETKRAAYVSLARPHLEYATALWDPYRQKQVEKLEAAQSRAVRVIKHDHDYYTKLKKSLSLELLSEGRKSHRLQIFHKSVYNDIALPAPPYYKSSIRETRNYSTNSFIQPSVYHDYYKFSFFPRTIRDWNCLLPETRALNYSAFCRAKLFYVLFKYSNFLIIIYFILIVLFIFIFLFLNSS